MPKRAAKVAISLPEDLLTEADRACRARGLSRSECVRMALLAFLQGERRREDVERYVKSYSEAPEADPEQAALADLGLQVMAEDRWE